ncbi:MAG: hypothetical protein F4180_08400 [Chloroflexi bacterium]|nr:hypothetical protein [Chloroflexota bacterium]
MAGSLTLIEGPVFSGKSQAARQAIEDDEADLLFEYSELWAATRAVERNEQGRYPVRRDDDAFNRGGFGAALMTAGVGLALKKKLRVIVSSGKRNTAEKWKAVADGAGAAFALRTIDPGPAVIEVAIIAAGDDEECVTAYQRWNPNFRRV